jgi:adenosylhomocysteine nucleosidase
MSLIVITGLAAEARIAVATDVPMIVGAGRADRLAADLEAAIAGGARRLLSFGIAGALAPGLQAGDLIVAHGVRDGARRLSCDPAWRAAMSDRLERSAGQRRLERVRNCETTDHSESPSSCGLFRFSRQDQWRPIEDAGCGRSLLADIAGADAPLADAESKSALFETSGSIAVDMESAIVARAAERHGLPFAILRVIADPAHRPLPSSALVAMHADGEVDLAAVLGALVRNPHELPALMRLAVDSREAFSSLARARALLGAEFASVDLGMILSRHSAPRRIHQDGPMELNIGRRGLCQAHDMA